MYYHPVNNHELDLPWRWTWITGAILATAPVLAFLIWFTMENSAASMPLPLAIIGALCTWPLGALILTALADKPVTAFTRYVLAESNMVNQAWRLAAVAAIGSFSFCALFFGTVWALFGFVLVTFTITVSVGFSLFAGLMLGIWYFDKQERATRTTSNLIHLRRPVRR